MSHIFGLEHSLGGIFGQVMSAGRPTQQIGQQQFLPTQSTITQGFLPAGPVTDVIVHADGSTEICKPKRRRRRRRLATQSDIRDLAALSTVLKGKAFDMWIASRGR